VSVHVLLLLTARLLRLPSMILQCQLELLNLLRQSR